ncbi:MAG: BatD family protein [Chthoniobacteraceae bacterium]
MTRALFSQMLCLAWLCASALAADVAVRAQLSQRVAEVGASVQLQVEINGARGDVMPPEVDVEGLQIAYAFPSTSQRVQMINGQITSERSTTHVFEVVPKREGEFTIPALVVTVDGRAYKTEPVALKVQKRGAGADDATKEAKVTAAIEVKKKSVFVGEAVPVEVRLSAEGQMRIEEVPNAPALSGDGFTIQKFPRFTQQQTTSGGMVIAFRTAMTATKAGKLTIGPCDIPFVARVARQRANRSKSLFDQFFPRDFTNPLSSESRRFDATAEAVEIEVKPLPVEGRPRDFSGAVGQFQFEGDGSPSTVKLGEPLTMRLRVTGEGNFDRVQAPTLVDADGWKAYEASEKFEAGNELKTTGTKAFEIPVVPEAKHRQMPQFQFSFFDPAAEKYVTLRSKPDALVVQGEPLVAPPARAAESPSAAATPAPAAAADIAGLRYEEGPRRTFAPIFERPVFWIAHGFAALFALGFVAARGLRRDPAKARIAALRSERDELWRALRGGGDDFHERAARFVQVEAAIVGDVEAVSVDAPVANRVLNADAETAAAIDAIFDGRAARLYAGGAAVAPVSAADSERVLRVLDKLWRR